MEYTEDLDIEELESRLYCQVYHVSADSSEPIIEDISFNTSTNYYRKKFRYFEQQPAKPPTDPVLTSISLTENELVRENNKESNIECANNFTAEYNDKFNNTSYHSNTIPLPSSSPIPASCENQELLQNIDNQHSLSLSINSNDILPFTPYYLPNLLPLVPPNISPIERRRKVKNKKRKTKNIKELKREIFPPAPPQLNQVTIYLSDSDSDDCVVLENMSNNIQKQVNTKFPKKYNEAVDEKVPEPDDDIIFIPPPPVVVINIDYDDGEKIVQEENTIKEPELLETPELNLSNDFLDNANVETANTSDFNFSLHGSDFHGQTEVVQPQKPTEYCETESSCSTNEQHSRDFSNTVKTIVFNEVEFPKEDIFSDKSLEGFSSFITPKRGNSSKTDEPVVKSKKSLDANAKSDTFSDVSSSESDYESNTKNLPNLSPMVPTDVPNKRVKNTEKVKTTGDKDEIVAKSKKNVDTNAKSTTLSDISSSESEYESNSKNVPNLSLIVSADIPNKRVKITGDKDELVAKSKKHINTNAKSDTLSDISSLESDYESNNKNLPNLSPMEPADIPNKRVKSTEKVKITGDKDEIVAKSKKNLDSNADKDESLGVALENPETVKGNKKEKCGRRKKRSLDNDELAGQNIEEEQISVDQLEEKGSQNVSKTKKKKKKDNSISETVEALENLANDQISTSTEDVSEKPKKKKKKRESITETPTELPTEPDLSNKEETSLNTDETEDDKLKKKKKKRENNVLNELTNEEEVIDNFIKDVEITMDLSRNLGQKKKKKKKKKKNVEDCGNSSFKSCESLQEDDETETVNVSNKKKKKKRDNITNISKTTENTDERTEVQNEIDSNTVLPHIPIFQDKPVEIDSENQDSFIIVDSTDSSDVELILSSDSDVDVEILDDIGNDLSINCSTSKSTVESTTVSDGIVNTIIENARAPLENFEQFSLEKVQNRQSDDPAKWQISYKDRGLSLYSNQNRGPRCNRCRHFGHIGIRCPEKPHPQPCILCGNPDHQEPRCPNKRCTQCGNPGAYSTSYCKQCFKFRHSVCNLCQMPGHIQKFCPDLWRRYHSTNDGPIVSSSELPKLKRFYQWCSGCAKQGHLEHECNYYNRQYPPTTPFIMNYSDCLGQNKNGTVPKLNHPLPQENPPVFNPPVINTPVYSPPVFNPPVVNTPVVNPSAFNMPVINPQMMNNMDNFMSPMPNLPDFVKRMILPHNSTPNVTIQVANNPVPNDIILQMKVNFNNDPGARNTEIIQSNQFKHPVRQTANIDLNDIQRIENLIMLKPNYEVRKFIQGQINYLRTSNMDPRVLKRKLFKYDRMAESKSFLPENVLCEKNFWYRSVNMFVFGIHKQADGRLHMHNLTRYLSERSHYSLDMHKRKSLFSSYKYIFGNNKHENVDYYKLIRILIRKNNSN